jgi:hypothetical protein
MAGGQRAKAGREKAMMTKQERTATYRVISHLREREKRQCYYKAVEGKSQAVFDNKKAPLSDGVGRERNERLFPLGFLRGRRGRLLGQAMSTRGF